jgi:hypothetical protein
MWSHPLIALNFILVQARIIQGIIAYAEIPDSKVTLDNSIQSQTLNLIGGCVIRSISTVFFSHLTTLAALIN